MHKPSRFLTWGLSLIFLLLTAGLVYADSGFYVDAAVGRTELDDNISGIALQDSATAFRANVGLDFGNNIALEAGYLNLGEFDLPTPGVPAVATLDGGTVSAVFRLPVSDSLSLSARGGFFMWDSEISDRFSVSVREGEDLFYGIGMQADISDQLSLTGEWDRFEFDNDTADALFFGFKFRF